jgi:hypothetical protein
MNKILSNYISLGIGLGIIGATCPAQAAITSFDLSQFAEYAQTSNAQPDSGSFLFFPSIQYTDLSDLSSAAVFYNNDEDLILLGNPLPSGDEFFKSKILYFSSQSELEAAFPNGTVYDYFIFGGTLGSQTGILQTPPVSLLPNVPFLTGTTYSQLQGLDPGQPFTFNFNEAVFNSEFDNFPNIRFRIFPEIEGSAVFDIDLDPTATSTLLPANTLVPNTGYSFNLQFVQSLFALDAGFDGASSFQGFFSTTEGSFTTGSIMGTTPENPFVPTPNPDNPDGGFIFPEVPVTGGGFFFFDPDVAVGYDYSVTGGPLFASVLIPSALPNGDSNFILELPGFGNFPLISGTPFDLLTLNPLGFNNFSITGIDTSEMLDPTNPLAFVTGLSFTNNGTVNVTQTPIIENIPDPVSTPEPSALLGLGLLGFGAFFKRQLNQKKLGQN